MTLGDIVDSDIQALPPLLAQLGYPAEATQVERRVAGILRAGARLVVARDGSRPVGVLALAFLPQIHHDDPLCRITALVVDESARGAGVGRRLVAEAERIALESGCQRIEVTSADHRAAAHAFYFALGYAEKRKRFMKLLDAGSDPGAR